MKKRVLGKTGELFCTITAALQPAFQLGCCRLAINDFQNIFRIDIFSEKGATLGFGDATLHLSYVPLRLLDEVVYFFIHVNRFYRLHDSLNSDKHASLINE